VVAACNAGFGDCDGMAANGCETNTTSSAQNCGSCGRVCANNVPYCFNSACTATPPYVALGTLSGQTYYKVAVTGAMTDTNVFNACKAAGLHTPCQATGVCQYNDQVCVVTQEKSCGNPMQTLSQALCAGANPSACPALAGCYQYMGHTWQNDSACGAENNSWCAIGNAQMNRFAVCVQ
jgi:hypothetical protein